MAGVSSTLDLFQSLHAGIDGVTSAPTSYPGSINTSELPMVLVFPAQAATRLQTFQPKAMGSARAKKEMIRDYSARLFIEPVGQDTVNSVMQTGITLLQRFLDAYWDNFVLAENLVQIREIRDSGITSGGQLVGNRGLSYAGIDYTGIIFEINVQEMFS